MTDTEPYKRYALSFTSGGLLVREAEIVVSEYLSVRDWGMARHAVTEQNLLQARTTSSSVRVSREAAQRVSVLEDSELEMFADLSYTERCHLMWAAACRRYELIGDFAEEVVRERFLLMTPTVGLEDFERFMARKGLWHTELDELKPSTRTKLRQSAFRMLHEAELLSKQGEILPALLSERIHEILAAHIPSDIRFFPTTLPMEVQR
ncbi:DUF1819 family protein [Salinibacterium sp. SWN1162]|uniref:DUF1819 family protein n=1 Tax=Salinibacterium sp. SWN1162 TaxID=2792053 RepID=UPI0018CF2E4F|nr:DUF1819 family protein [Salinibacterium sp. SWN1162]MBH0009580.1 DUF1819 family protein [Salinibacterium sp. SWN1162]